MVEFDIASYLRTLPRIQLHQLEDIECSVCHNNYLEENENGYVDNAIILPCEHAFGKACISRWLKPFPEGANANTCPLCREQLFEAWPEAPQTQPEIQPVMFIRGRRYIATLGQRISDARPIFSQNIEPIAFNGRRVAVRETQTYDALVEAGVGLQQRAGYPDDLLTFGQDHALFVVLQERGAFRCEAMNEFHRIDRGGRLADSRIYEKLRDQGLHWNIDKEAWYQDVTEFYKDSEEEG